MKKSFKKVMLFGAMLLALGASFVGCKDYDDDIENLQQQIDANASEIKKINELINSGSVITDVNNVDNGIEIVLSNGKSYTITNGKDGVNGQDGTNGADANVWTIEEGENGKLYWAVNGVINTDYPAQGEKGDKGDNGADGEGSGIYYYPNEDGYWYLVTDPADPTGEKSIYQWTISGANYITAAFDGDALVLYGVPGFEDGYTLYNSPALLRSLVFIPQSIVNGVPAMDFSAFSYFPMRKSDDTEISTANGSLVTVTPEIEAKYHLNPSSVNTSLMDLENLAFTYKEANSYTRSSAINAQATYVSADDGILVVKVDVASEYVYSDNRLDLIALQVPVTEETGESVVTSDYATIYKNEKIQPRLWIAQPYMPNDGNALANVGTADNDYHYPRFFEEAMTVDAEASFVYNGTLDLRKLVQSHYGEDPATGDTSREYFDSQFTKYGLAYKFEVVADKQFITNETGVSTDQQQFAEMVNETTLRARVYDDESGTYAAIGRTPIVRVTIVDTNNNDAIVRIGYIKVLITGEIVGPQTLPVNLGSIDQAACYDQVVYTTAYQMNTMVYNKSGLSKENFHLNYPTYTIATENPGVVEVLENLEETQTYGIRWTLTNDEIWANNSFKAYVTYHSVTSDRGDITLELQLAVNKPTNPTMATKVPNYWENNVTKLNVAVPNGVSDVAVNCTFINNLNNPFYTIGSGNKIGMLDLTYPTWTPKLTINNTTQTTYWNDMVVNYRFTSANNRTVAGVENSYAVRVVNGTELWAGTQVIATIQSAAIENGKYVNNLVYNENSDIAKDLLATNAFQAYIEAYGTLCNNEVTIDNATFTVQFVRPLNIQTSSANPFVDGVDQGAAGSYLLVEDVVRMYDWRGTNYPVTETPLSYWNYYGVQNIAIDETKKITCTLGEGGSVINLLSTLEVTMSTDGSRFNYENNGNVLEREFNIYLPIVVEYKWGRVRETITIPVKTTVGQN